MTGDQTHSLYLVDLVHHKSLWSCLLLEAFLSKNFVELAEFVVRLGAIWKDRDLLQLSVAGDELGDLHRQTVPLSNVTGIHLCKIHDVGICTLEE